MNPTFSIAIDGPAGSGKSTVAKIIAKRLNFKYINSGFFYRAVAYYMQQNNLTFDMVQDWNKQILDRLNLKWKDNIIYMNDESINEELKSNRYSSLASQVAVIPFVRNYVNDNILKISQTNNIVVDGRDIGTVVLPHATVKVFLDADIETRAKRRFDEIVAIGGNPPDMETLINSIIERDNRDYTREIAPLKKADDAVLIDSSRMNIEEATEAVINAFYAVASGETINDKFEN